MIYSISNDYFDSLHVKVTHFSPSLSLSLSISLVLTGVRLYVYTFELRTTILLFTEINWIHWKAHATHSNHPINQISKYQGKKHTSEWETEWKEQTNGTYERTQRV